MGNTFSCLCPSWKNDNSSCQRQFETDIYDLAEPVANRMENDECVWKIVDLETDVYAASTSNQTSTYDDPISSPEGGKEKAAEDSALTELSQHDSIDSGFADFSGSGQDLVKTGDCQRNRSREGNYQDIKRVQDPDCIPVTLRQANEDYSKRMNKQRQMTRALLKLQRSPSPVKAIEIAIEANAEDTAHSMGDMSEKAEEIHIYSETDSVKAKSLVRLQDAFLTEFSVDTYAKDVKPVSSVGNVKTEETVDEFDPDDDIKGEAPMSLHSEESPVKEKEDEAEDKEEYDNDDCIASDTCTSGCSTVLFSQLDDTEFSDCLSMFKRGASMGNVILTDKESTEISNDTYTPSDIEDIDNADEASDNIDEDCVTHACLDEIVDYRNPSKKKRKQRIREHKMHKLRTIFEFTWEEEKAEIEDFCTSLINTCVDMIKIESNVTSICDIVQDKNTDDVNDKDNYPNNLDKDSFSVEIVTKDESLELATNFKEFAQATPFIRMCDGAENKNHILENKAFLESTEVDNDNYGESCASDTNELTINVEKMIIPSVDATEERKELKDYCLRIIDLCIGAVDFEKINIGYSNTFQNIRTSEGKTELCQKIQVETHGGYQHPNTHNRDRLTMAGIVSSNVNNASRETSQMNSIKTPNVCIPECVKAVMATCINDTKSLTTSKTKHIKKTTKNNDNTNMMPLKRKSAENKNKVDFTLPTKEKRKIKSVGSSKSGKMEPQQTRRTAGSAESTKKTSLVENNGIQQRTPSEDDNYEIVKQRGPDRGIVWPQTMEELYSAKDRAYFVEQFQRTELFRQRLTRKQDNNNAWSRALTQFQIWVIEHIGTKEMESILHPKVKKRQNMTKAKVTCWKGQTM